MRSSRRFGTCRRGLKNQRCIPSLDARRARQPAFAGRVEHPVRVARLHAVDGGSRGGGSAGSRAGSSRSARRAHESSRCAPRSPTPPRARRELVAVQRGDVAEPARPRARRRREGRGRRAAIAPGEPLAQPVDDRRCRRRRGSRADRAGRPRRVASSADARREPCARCDRRATRRRARGGAAPPRACRTPASPRRRRPSTDRPAERAAERVAEPADRRVVLEHEDVLVRLDQLREPGGIDAVQPRHVHDRERDARLSRASSDGDERLVQHHRPVREQDGVAALAQHDSAPDGRLVARRRARSDAATARSRAGSRRSPSASSTAQRTSASRLLGVRRLHDRHVRKRREQRDVAKTLVRLPRAGRDQTRVVERVDDLRALARLVVDLLVRPRREEGRERVDDREEARAAPARRRSRPCPARRSRTRRTDRDRPARTRARGSRRRGRRRARRAARARSPSSTSASPYASTTYSSVTPVGSARPRRSPARLRGCARLLDRARAARTSAARGRARRTPPRSARRAPRARARTARRPERPRASGRCRRPRASADRMLHERDALALDRVRDERLRPSRRPRGSARRRPRSAAWSCPSQVSTSQPNARSFVSRSPSARISSVGLSDCSSLRSTTIQSPPRRSWAAAWSASQFWPSCSSPSPVITTTTPSRPTSALRPRDPATLRDAHAERARVRLDSRHADIRMPVEPAEPAQPREPLGREHAEPVERRVQARHVVALRREEDVAVRDRRTRARRRSAPS